MNNQVKEIINTDEHVKEIINTDEHGFSTYTVKLDGDILIGCGIIDNKGNQLVKFNTEITRIDRIADENGRTTGYKIINSRNPKGYTYFNIGALIEKSKFLQNNKGRV